MSSQKGKVLYRMCFKKGVDKTAKSGCFYSRDWETGYSFPYNLLQLPKDLQSASTNIDK